MSRQYPPILRRFLHPNTPKNSLEWPIHSHEYGRFRSFFLHLSPNRSTKNTPTTVPTTALETHTTPNSYTDHCRKSNTSSWSSS
mmetsp:Transcript_25183/g.29815  ORF Transcript_25183/g.29815 Transcript_25183/m.29815 type:complete len:84 (+) Transcript_25183:62-313(+)